MLAAHRDQENLVHSHQVSGKQHPKTPGARYPKTPLKYGQNDENAPTAFAGKNGLGGTRLGGQDKITMTKGKQSMVTPTGPQSQSRAPLGNKTTNAKARAGQVGGTKNIEKSQAKPTTVQKPKPKVISQGPLQIEADTKSFDPLEDEPEYAPPKPKDLPYESDLLPPGGLTFEGLKKENLLRGFYQQFHNPVDDNGVSRKEKRFNEEMKLVMDKAIEKNNRDLEALDWNVSDTPEPPKLIQRKPDAPEVAETKMGRKVRGTGHSRQLSTITSRKAASALSMQPPSGRPQLPRPTSAMSAGRRPLSSLVSGQRTVRQAERSTRPQSAASNSGEVASRTTIGYSKGKSASSLVHARETASTAARGQTMTKTRVLRDVDPHSTITPARAQEAGLTGARPSQTVRPQFTSIFGQDDEEDDLPAIIAPFPSDDEDEEFELKFDI
ncbi:unnamed protein product [Clonostachys solani]|uniref:Uncharacterized protein n=1 Tax=Clonostachys solani TaxID=160281 RepID=A0A9P0EL69_9HYPO|nr:unnamed protein product [Clonostachys solani]